MRRVALVPLVTVAAFVNLSLATPAPLHAARRAPSGLTWLALGDSFSSGEGLENNDIAANPPDRTSLSGQPVKAQNCERATGTSTTKPASRTWSVVARDVLADARNGTPMEFASFSLKACTGAVTNDWRKQWEEAGATHSDLVTFSMGGNNIGFAKTIEACAGLSVDGGIDAVIGGLPLWTFDPSLGCDLTEDELRHRVDQLVGNDPDPNKQHTAYDNTQTLPDMYREIAENAVTPGGHVLVLGYPNLIEESGKWTWRLLSGNRCHRIRRADANMFRRVLGYLNEQTALAVQAANGQYKGVHFDWLDVSKVYENDTTGHHGLCTGEPWLNGVTVGVDGPDAGLLGFRVFRSFHPKQLGYDATGVAVASVVRGFDWSSLQKAPPFAADGTQPFVISKIDLASRTITLTPAAGGPSVTARLGDDFRVLEALRQEVSLTAFAAYVNAQPTPPVPEQVAVITKDGAVSVVSPFVGDGDGEGVDFDYCWVSGYSAMDVNGEIVACPGDPRPGITELQQDLNRLGYGPVSVDGQLGPQTRAALTAVRSANGMRETGRADLGTLAAIKAQLRDQVDAQCVSDPGDYGAELASKHAVMQVGPAVCEQYWWLVSYTVDEAYDDSSGVPDLHPAVALFSYGEGGRGLLNWWEFVDQGPSASGYTQEALIREGVPAEVAARLMARLAAAMS